MWNIVSRRIKKICNFWTCPRKIEFKVQPIDLLSWIKISRFWIESRKLPAKFQLCKSFQSLRTQGPQGFFGAPYWSHQKRSWPQKIPRACFDLLSLCVKFQDHIWTGSIFNRWTTRPLKIKKLCLIPRAALQPLNCIKDKRRERKDRGLI